MDVATEQEPVQKATIPPDGDLSPPELLPGALLTERQREFCAEILKGATNTAAYIAAYPGVQTKKEAANRGRKLARLPKIQEFLTALKDKTLDFLDVTPQRITQEISRIAFSDIRQLFDPTGEILPVQDWPDHIAACVSSYEEEIKAGGTVLKRKIRLWPKVESLKLLADTKAMTNAKPDAAQRATFTFNFGSGKGAARGKMGGKLVERVINQIPAPPAVLLPANNAPKA